MTVYIVNMTLSLYIYIEREYFTKLPVKNLKAILNSPAIKKNRPADCSLLSSALHQFTVGSRPQYDRHSATRK